MQNLYLYAIPVLLLAVFMVYHEVKRANRKRLFLRILAVLFSAAALLCLIVPLKYNAERITNAKSLNFLTEGVIAAKLSADEYFTSDTEIIKTLGKDRVTYIPDLLYHLATHPEISSVNVYGYGLPEHVLNKLKDIKIIFHPVNLPLGFTDCNWSETLPASEVQRVQGHFNNSSSRPVKVLLEGLGTRLDSVTIPAGKHQSFTLSCTPRQTGRAVYQLQAFAGGERVASEEIPFQVVEQPKTKILVLASFPDFENKFLRNWLLDHKYPALFQTRISKDKFSTEQVNLEGSGSPVLTAATFKNYDLVIADDEELASLGTLHAALQREIEAGLGLLVRLNEAEPLSRFSKMFNIRSTTDTITSSLQPVLSENNQQLKAVPVRQPIYLSASNTQQVLVADPKGKALVNTTLQGNGRVTATAIPATFNWVLNASTADYSNYWSTLIKQTARKTNNEFYWNVEPKMPRVGEQVKINFQNESDVMPSIQLSSRNLAVQQHLVLPFYWQSSFRAKGKGWNTFSVASGKEQAVYVHDTSAWSGVKAKEMIITNISFEKMQDKKSETAQNLVQKVEKSVSKWVIFAIFLVSVGFLWFETKILQ
jgi:hypothetical protein